jgi:hypothetical protein
LFVACHSGAKIIAPSGDTLEERLSFAKPVEEPVVEPEPPPPVAAAKPTVAQASDELSERWTERMSASPLKKRRPRRA